MYNVFYLDRTVFFFLSYVVSPSYLYTVKNCVEFSPSFETIYPNFRVNLIQDEFVVIESTNINVHQIDTNM